MPTARALQFLDLTYFTSASVAISLLCLEYRGIASPYSFGISMVLVLRAVMTGEHWKQGVVRMGIPVLAHPLTLLVAAAFLPRIAAQLHDPAALATFAHDLFFILATAVFLVWGGHGVWLLNRQLFEARSIGRYHLVRKIGAGGMGEVWCAYHAALKRQVAIKILRPEAGMAEVRIARFEREVRATTELSHPNTVRVIDYGVTEDGLWYYVMELLDGVDLAHCVAATGAFAPTRAVHVVGQASRALAEAHARGIVHRDIKPENLFITTLGGEKDFVKVLDFGMAKLVDPARQLDTSLTGAGMVAGTPEYMSPEAASGKPVDARSDVYSLGAVLYFLLAGKPPFQGESAVEIMTAQVSKRPLPPSAKLGRVLPAPLEALVMRCLAKSPDVRFDSAAELAGELERIRRSMLS